MDFDETLRLIKDAKRLGLKSVKFLGASEPFQNERFFEFLRELKKLDVTLLVFTKGHVIGDDAEARKWNSQYGISTGKELVEEITKVNASIMLGFNSFDLCTQDEMVGGMEGYSLKRNRAPELLAEAGLNKHNPSRLCLAVLPVTCGNYSEILEIYEWARVRNISVIACPTMVSGKGSNEGAWQKITPQASVLIDLYAEIYEFNLEKGIQTIEQLEEKEFHIMPRQRAATKSPVGGTSRFQVKSCGVPATT